jgi:transposase
MNHTRVIAIDLSKQVFQVSVIDRHGQEIMNQSMQRKALAAWLARQRPAVVAMEACSGAHHWGRLAQSLDHRVVIIPPKQVTPYRQGQKHDANDALAIGIAARQPKLKTVGVKSLDQQSVQCDKRVQEHLSDQLTATGNLLRALVAEFGVVIPKGIAALRRELPLILEDAENGLPLAMRESLYLAWQQWLVLADTLKQVEQILMARIDQLPPCQRLTALEGVGPKNALGLYIRLAMAITSRTAVWPPPVSASRPSNRAPAAKYA